MTFSVLVEGSDDKHLIKNVAREHGLELEQAAFRDCGGIDKLLGDILPVMLKSSLKAIAVIVDADLDLEARWQAIGYRLSTAGYAVPPIPPAEGLVINQNSPAVGVWLMPNNLIPGTLEDFAEHLIHPADALWPRAIRAVADIPPADRRFTSAKKAEIHTYLAWQEEPGTPLGMAVTKRYFETDAELCDRFVRWLRRLKELAQPE